MEQTWAEELHGVKATGLWPVGGEAAEMTLS